MVLFVIKPFNRKVHVCFVFAALIGRYYIIITRQRLRRQMIPRKMLMYKRLCLSLRSYVYVRLKSTKSHVYSKAKQAYLVYVINIDLDKVNANCMFGFL